MVTIGITGTSGAGKGTIVEYLVSQKGYVHYSVGDFLKSELKKRKKEPTRKNLQDIGNELREKKGPEYIVKTLFAKAIKKGADAVIESIRNPKEADFIKKQPNSFLLSIDADIKTRYKRISARHETKDRVTFKEFSDGEKREKKSKNTSSQNLIYCMDSADFKLNNNGTVNELYKKADNILEKMHKYVRPSWDDYFMEVADAISKRATCDRGRSGCVIAKDKRILATGYVGSPTGFPHCDEAGHELKKVLNEDGTISEHCVRTVHAEQNAICQAAKQGVSIEGADIYCRMTPCRTCAMLIINCGIKRVFCERMYHRGVESEQMFKKAKIKLTYKYKELQKYN
jgi:dCMP deaminase